MNADGERTAVSGRALDPLREGRWELEDAQGRALTPVPTREGKPPVLESVYALTKFDQERLALIMGRAYGIPTVALRLFDVTGRVRPCRIHTRGCSPSSPRAYSMAALRCCSRMASGVGTSSACTMSRRRFWALMGAPPSDALLKLDGADHGDDHCYPGPCDTAWDLAGAIIELGLDTARADSFLALYRRRSGDDARARVGPYLVAYVAERVGRLEIAALSADASEKVRLERELTWYRMRLGALLAPARGERRGGVDVNGALS